jgi:hypothetical protein
MKKYLIFITTLLVFMMLSPITKANDDESVKRFLFPQFENGYVILKEGYTKLSTQFNYDMVDEVMIYRESEKSIIVLDASAVVSVIINGRIFIPSKGLAFYEKIEAGSNEFYICHKTKEISGGKATGYGGYSQTASVTGLVVSTSNTTYMFHPDEKIEGIDESAVYLKNGKKFEKINSLKTLLKFFKSHQTEIEVYSKDNKTNFNAIGNVVAIVEYAFSL